MYAVIRAGGKQVKVSEGAVVEVERQHANPGDSITFSEVLMLADGDSLNVGTPLVEKANVFGTVLGVFRAPKVLIFKKKRRKQYRRTRGHRQYLTRIRIDELGLYDERKRKPQEMEPKVAAPPKKVEVAAEAEPARKRAKKEKQTAKKSAASARVKIKTAKEKSAAKKKTTPKSKRAKSGSKGKKR